MTPEIWPVTDAGGAESGENEDFVLVYAPDDPDEMLLSGSLYIVADGMGGGSRGQIASQYAAKRIMQLYYLTVGEPDLGLRLRDAIENTNLELYSYALQRPELVKLSTTVVAAVVRGEQMHVASVGNSRAYLIREGSITQVTKDHTLVQQLLDEQAISASEAREHPRRDVVMRSLGAEEGVSVDVYDMRLHADDALLLCTDGLTAFMHDDEITDIVSNMSPRAAAETLLRKVQDRGGKDNISVVSVLLRDGAPPLVTDVPHMWDRSEPTFNGDALQSASTPQPSERPPAVAPQDQSADETRAVQRRSEEPPIDPGDTIVRGTGDWLEAPETGIHKRPDQHDQPPAAPRYQQQEAQAPGYQSPVEPAPQYGEPQPDQRPGTGPLVPPQALQDHPDAWAGGQQPRQPTPPGTQTPPEGLPAPGRAPERPPTQQPGQYPPYQGPPPQQGGYYPPQQGGYPPQEPYPPYDQGYGQGQRGVPRGYQPPPGQQAPIDPVTGLPAVPAGSPYIDPYSPRVYQPPGAPASVQQPRRSGISLGMFAGIGLLVILLTAVIVMLVVNPFGFELPFGGSGEEIADATPEDGAAEPEQPAEAEQPAVEQPAAEQPTPTVPPVAQAPPGMVLIEGGPYLRGVPEDEVNTAIRNCINEDINEGDPLCIPELFSDAQPVEDVTVSPFFLDQFEVTNEEYANCVASDVCTPPNDPTFFNDAAFATHPVVEVTWGQASQYCSFAGKRLPTEAEWEKAARWDPSQEAARVWPWGNSFEDGRANTFSAGIGGTASVESFEGDVSPWGVRGMSGNISEWIQDWYLGNYESLGTLNPVGPANQPLGQPIRVVRGGSYLDIATYARGGHRLSVNENSSEPWLGFRCAQSVDGAPAPVVETPEEPAAEETVEEGTTTEGDTSGDGDTGTEDTGTGTSGDGS